ncbi:MAG: sulfatase-like hydrolase/transferase [Haloferula sp.]
MKWLWHGLLMLHAFSHAAWSKPNIVFILADDLGYGDVACYNPESKVPTPHLDRLARQGMRFTDAHSPSTVCTPSRYSLLTGRMAFRLNYKGVFTGVGGPCLIKEERLTLPAMLKERGYATAMFGKWHIGMTFFDKEGEPILKGGIEGVKRVDYSRPTTDGPVHRGFDEFFGTVCCPTTDWLYAYVEGDRIPVPPTRLIDKSHLPDHPYSKDCRTGMIAPDFDMQEVDMKFLEKSEAFLDRHVEENPDKPFFLFHSAQAVHLPSFAGKDFRGKTKAGPHGDFIHQFDAIVGRILKKLDDLGIADETIVMVSSDNGPELPTVHDMRKVYQHDGAHPWRGVKRDNWEGGHRVPFIVRWPGVVKPGSESGQTVNLTDVMATLAETIDYPLPQEAAEDSVSFVRVLRGELDEGESFREYALHQTISLALAIREGKWKYLDHRGSGGNNYERTGQWGAAIYALPEEEPESPGQLYNLETDPGERHNLYSKHPEIVERLKGRLEASKSSGRSAPWPRK